MSALPSLVLGFGLALPMAPEALEPHAPADPARLREMLLDRQHPRSQSQAALMLVQSRLPAAEEIVRQGLRQADASEVFGSLATAIRLCRDPRFVDELLAGLSNGQAGIRQAAIEALAVHPDPQMITRLQALAQDGHLDLTARQAALNTLGRIGSRPAVAVLLQHLSSKEEPLRQSAQETLASLTGQPPGTNLRSWHVWWDYRKNLSNERWLEERLAFQTARTRRLEGDLGRACGQVVRLHQQLYTRLPPGDRLGHVASLIDHEDAAVRTLAVTWSVELLAGTDAVGQRQLGEILLRLSWDGAVEVQRPAVLALGRVQDPRAFGQLAHVLEQGPPAVRAAAVQSLAQQAMTPGADSQARQRQAIPLLQRALDDTAQEVVIAAAEGLGSLGIPEATPVLVALLKHPTEPARQTAAQALERVADGQVLDGMLAALEDPVVAIRFSLVGAIGRAAGDGQRLTDPQRARVVSRLEELLLRDADPGVRSRAATVLGQCASATELPFLQRRLLSREDPRVQEKTWAAVADIMARTARPEVLHEWDQKLAEAKLGPRRLELLGEVLARWKKTEATKSLVIPATEILIQAQFDEGKWAAAFGLVRELLHGPGTDVEVDRRMRWLLNVGELALRDGNRPEALRVVQEAQPLLTRRPVWAADVEKLEKKARQER